MTPSELNIPICPRCGSKIRPEFKNDFFSYCSYSCLKGFKDDYEAAETQEERVAASGLWGKRSVL